jgi:heptosyltransferase-2
MRALEEKINEDCIHFSGYKPCKQHKEFGVHCKNCKYYSPIGKKILIIKKGAAGEVIRNTPILRKIKEEFGDPYVVWITDYPELVPLDFVNEIRKFDWKGAYLTENEKFDIVYSLDKERESCLLAKKIKAKLKKGFTVDDNLRIIPFDKDAEHKFLTGIFDDVMKANKKHYIEEIFEICGYKFNNEKYILPKYEKYNLRTNKPVVGLNTGAGAAWKTRIWPKENWIELIKLLNKKYTVILLGGPDEDEINKEISKKTKALYFGVLPYSKFIGLMNECDVIVTSISFAFHVAIGLEKPTVAFVNIFPKNEFYTYDVPVIFLEPNLPCQACYKPVFNEKCPVENCMKLITPKQVYEAIEKVKKNERKA